jgi:type IV secretion system protein TrbJ
MKKRFAPYLKGGAVTTAVVLFLPLATPRRSDGMIPVFDAGNWAMLGHIWSEDISTGAKLIQEYNQLVKIYTSGMQIYNLGMSMATSFKTGDKSAWMTLAQLATNDLTQDKYGETLTWPAMINGHPGLAPQAWATATFPVTHDSFMLGEIPGGSRLLAKLASLHAIDGASVDCLETIGNYRGNAAMNLAPILKLAISHLDGTASTNSNIEQLNMVNAHQEQANNELRAQGALASCLAQQATLQNKLQRDDIAEALELQGEIHDLNAATDLNWGDSAATITNYRPR